MRRRGPRRRAVVNALMLGLLGAAALAAVLPLVLILAYLCRAGLGALDAAFLTRAPAPVGAAGGGMGNAIAGTLLLVGMACLVGLPVGVGAGVYLAEYRGGRFAALVRYLCDVLNGTPSIVVGVVAWELFVRPAGHFSALAGAAALGAMLVPLVTRTTEELVRTVPGALRDAALALGYPRWRTALAVVLPAALPGIATGALVAVARIAGETAPLLFTAFGNQFWSLDPRQPVAALPLQIFTYALSPYAAWHRQAWAGALVLLALVFAVRAAARYAARPRYGYGAGPGAGG